MARYAEAMPLICAAKYVFCCVEERAHSRYAHGMARRACCAARVLYIAQRRAILDIDDYDNGDMRERHYFCCCRRRLCHDAITRKRARRLILFTPPAILLPPMLRRHAMIDLPPLPPLFSLALFTSYGTIR